MNYDILNLGIDEGKILLVDDSVENLKLLSGLLSDTYKIKVAKDGMTALKHLNNDRSIRLVLLDIEMPDMDGIQVCQHIKANPMTRDIPVIFITGRNDTETEVEGLKAGGVDYITKPFKPEIIHARVKSQWQLQAAQARADTLLYALLPHNVVQALLKNGHYTPQLHEHASVLFLDLVGFTQIATKLSPETLINEMNTLFSAFDRIVLKHRLLRIKTMGDGYIIASGVDGNSEDHAKRMARAALALVEAVKDHAENGDIPWQCRIGCNSGQIISGIVGTHRFQFDVMGSTVNMAARVESNGGTMMVTVTQDFIDAIGDANVQTRSRGIVDLKGKGETELFELISLD